MSELHSKTFTWRPVQDKTVIHPEILAGMGKPEESLFLDEVYQRMIYNIRTHVLSYELPGHVVKREHAVVYRVPTSSWQMFKQEHQNAWWMRWLVTRRPVRETEYTRRVEFEAVWEDYAVYPWQRVAPTDRYLGSRVRHVQLAVWVEAHPETTGEPGEPEASETPEAPARGDKAGAS